MKRCPKCEFIYEDDQSLCDMDGVLLVLDSRKLPSRHALQTVPATKTAPRRNRAVPAFATVILALVLGLVYYVSVYRKATQSNYTPPPPSAASTTTNPVPAEVNVNPMTESQPPASEDPKPEPAKPTAAAAVPAPVKKVTAKPAPTPVKAKVEEKKEESKVNSILKKTGRILKKPFKF